MKSILITSCFIFLFSTITFAQSNKGYYREFDSVGISLYASSSINLDSNRTLTYIASSAPYRTFTDSNYYQLILLNQDGSIAKKITKKRQSQIFEYNVQLLRQDSKIYLLSPVSGKEQNITKYYLLMTVFDLNLNTLSEQLISIGNTTYSNKLSKDIVTSQLVALVNTLDSSTLYKFNLLGQLLFSKSVPNNSIRRYENFDVFKNNARYIFFNGQQSQAYVADINLDSIYSTTTFSRNLQNLSYRLPYIQLWNDSVVLLAGATSNGTNNSLFLLRQNIGQGIFNQQYFEINTSNRLASYPALLKPFDVKQKTIYLGGNFGGSPYALYDTTTTRNAAAAIKLDSNLNEIWRYTLDSGFYYTTLGITATDDGGCLLYGTKQVSRTERRLVAFLLKLRADGTITALNEPNATIADRIKVYPNLVADDLTIEMPDYANGAIQVFDLLGGNVFQQNLTAAVQTLHLPPLARGAYIYKIVQQEQVLKVGKMVKQ